LSNSTIWWWHLPIFYYWWRWSQILPPPSHFILNAVPLLKVLKGVAHRDWEYLQPYSDPNTNVDWGYCNVCDWLFQLIIIKYIYKSYSKFD
jgi:hypothetical protein